MNLASRIKSKPRVELVSTSNLTQEHKSSALEKVHRPMDESHWRIHRRDKGVFLRRRANKGSKGITIQTEKSGCQKVKEKQSRFARC
jgi:hypothetical protein